MFECPVGFLFAVDYMDFSPCVTCPLKKDCKEIKEKYQIKNRDEKIIFYKANKFVFEVFDAGWSHHYSMIDYAKEKGYAEKQIKGNKKEKWVISYKQIFHMMMELIPFYKATPIYKKKNGGYLYGKK